MCPRAWSSAPGTGVAGRALALRLPRHAAPDGDAAGRIVAAEQRHGAAAEGEDQHHAGDEAADVRPPADVLGSSAPEGGEELEAEPEDQQQPKTEEHTSELQSLMRISYAVFCLKKK